MTRAGSFNQGVVAAGEHAQWFTRTLDRPDRHLLIAELQGEPIGVVRFDQANDEAWEISIALAPTARGRRLAGAVIDAGMAWLTAREPVAVVRARVKPVNTASLRAFARTGFAESSRDERAVVLERWCG